MKLVTGLFMFLRQRFVVMALGAIIFGLVFQAGSLVHLGQQAETNQLKQLQQLQKSQDDQTKKITNQTDQIKVQNGRIEALSQTVLCYLQLTNGGDFTDRDECQRRIAESNAMTNLLIAPEPQPSAPLSVVSPKSDTKVQVAPGPKAPLLCIDSKPKKFCL